MKPLTLRQLPVALAFMAALLVGCDTRDPGNSPGGNLKFNDFLNEYTQTVSKDPVGGDTLPPGKACTALTDSAPFDDTIQRAVELIREQVDGELVAEALAHLQGGIRFHKIRMPELRQYSALYRDRSILLFDQLFSYGCLEDVASTLLHEMVHAVQMDRHLAGNKLPGGFDVSPDSRSWLAAELMAEAYQMRVSRSLDWLTEAHADKILRLHNKRRALIP